MSAPRPRKASQQTPLIRRRRAVARIKLVGRAIGLLQLAADLLEGAGQLGEQPRAEITAAQRSLARALRALAAPRPPGSPVPRRKDDE